MCLINFMGLRLIICGIPGMQNLYHRGYKICIPGDTHIIFFFHSRNADSLAWFRIKMHQKHFKQIILTQWSTTNMCTAPYLVTVSYEVQVTWQIKNPKITKTACIPGIQAVLEMSKNEKSSLVYHCTLEASLFSSHNYFHWKTNGFGDFEIFEHFWTF